MLARAGRLFGPCRSLGVSISIYNTNLNGIQQTIKRLALACFSLQQCKRPYTCMHIFSGKKNDYRSDLHKMLDYHPGKFHIDTLGSF
jgi:hypothetical protein